MCFSTPAKRWYSLISFGVHKRQSRLVHSTLLLCCSLTSSYCLPFFVNTSSLPSFHHVFSTSSRVICPVSEAWQHSSVTSSAPAAASLCSGRSSPSVAWCGHYSPISQASSVYPATRPSLDAATTSLLPARNWCMASTSPRTFSVRFRRIGYHQSLRQAERHAETDSRHVVDGRSFVVLVAPIDTLQSFV